jgi:hypothetical protein
VVCDASTANGSAAVRCGVLCVVSVGGVPALEVSGFGALTVTNPLSAADEPRGAGAPSADAIAGSVAPGDASADRDATTVGWEMRGLLAGA